MFEENRNAEVVETQRLQDLKSRRKDSEEEKVMLHLFRFTDDQYTNNTIPSATTHEAT